MEYLSKILLFIFLFFQILVKALGVQAQNYQCFLYGTITTIDGDVYEGPIRWNDEEVFLTDMFNSEKVENPYLKYLDTKSTDDNYKERKRESYWYGLVYNESNRSGAGRYGRKFQCRFGDIKSISVTGSESVILELNAGKFINLSGGSNDLGNRVWILDHELGLLKIDWRRIEIVNFFTPKKEVKEKFGEPIYGKLTTTIGEFSGFIQWDHDERLLQDKLDGESRDGDLAIEFSKIAKIEKAEKGSRIALKSGREIVLEKSNDVSKTNRGIIISTPEVGRIDFSWEHFLSLEMQEYPSDIANCNYEFPESQRLYGTIRTKDDRLLEGVIVYDLDEAMDAEILDGLNDKLEFSIPFRNIKTIQPKAYNYCLVELKNGQNLYLGDQVDVSNRSLGFLVFTKEDEYHYLKWEEIEEIRFL